MYSLNHILILIKDYRERFEERVRKNNPKMLYGGAAFPVRYEYFNLV